MKVVSDAGASGLAARRVSTGRKHCSFADAHFCVIGIGGVGSAAEALARTGIGKIPDRHGRCVTNTNRQIHALQGNVGRAKTEVMAQRIHAINPE